MADERSYYQATYQGHQQQYSGQQHHGGRGGGPGPGATGPPGAPGPQPPAVGWGGQQIQEPSGYRVPWFGRSRSKYGGRFGGKKGDPGPPGAPPRYGGPGGAGPSNRGAEDALSVEEMAVIIQKLGQNEELPEVIFRALHHVDSRAVALLLKDLSRLGKDRRAMELFDWLRSANERSPLRQLCDVYSYTATISLCIYSQDVDRAMELMNEMRQRNIERNVHTFTALMNVCIKCGKLPLALEIYNNMRAANCMPNVVTYNTLVDVYGKLGRWERAIHVLDLMKQEGVEPVLRTYNTLIIACNMCNQPREALAVYQRLLSDGYTPNSTTYNALISAYGKTMQLGKALEVYQEMLRQNMERSVITYSSLISACEKAGQWETALRIFNEMQQDNCVPNTVTYNSLVTACAQGGQWEKATEVFEQMTAHGCTPDVVTYTALISAYERGGQWQKALQAFGKMCMQGCKPDAIVYNAIIDTLWETGIIWAQGRALQLFLTAVQQGHFRQEPVVRRAGRVEVNLHAMTAGVAMVCLYCWLLEIKRIAAEKGLAGLPQTLAIVTDMGKASREQGNCIVKEAVAAMMSFWDAPFRLVQDGAYASVLEATSAQVVEWVTSMPFSAQLASLFPITDSSKMTEDMYAVREQQVLQECQEAFAAVQHFENTHGLVLSNMSTGYVQQRPVLISRLLDLSSKLGLRDEVVHDAVLLMDRTASQAKQVAEDVLPLVGVAALVIAAKQGDSSDRVPTNAEIEQITELPPTSVAKMEWNIRGLLADDISAISTMRCLKVYLERLGYRYLDKQDVYGMAGFAIMLAVESLYDLSLLNCRPSVVAAAILYAERRLRGAVPFWPSMLSKMTGYHDMSTPELTVAVRVAQKLSRKLVYAQMYKAQLIQLAGQAGPIAGPVSVAPELITGPPSASAAAAAAGGSMVAPGMRGPPPPPPMGGALGAAGVMMPPPPPVMMQTAMQGGLVQPTGWPPQARFDPLAAQHAAQAGGQAGGVGPSGVGQQADDGATITALTQAMQGLTTGGRVMQPDWQRLGGPVDDGSEGPGR
ncbi:hypothetical protein CHLRE_12g511400v5 [Chlamydomonas reinhardtii]|uniref:Uncharacterized protein n=1 Tax=Chlamydomonas reinhardtii TaxID=3055 RepID=A0A2K3D2J1_CHLRE|nr:uncharacterized protein CHLRE_12g511400v5 [Chlamydomonas reinhardtii]PNW74754.1 hypothetical protein CHLRE_12g511400v5 [Chlamydomonas reinhardtii]